MSPRAAILCLALVTCLAAVPAQAFPIVFADADFSSLTPVFSTVTTFNFDIEVSGPLQTGTYADPTIDQIEYNVSGALGSTPSGFPAFNFQLSHLIAPPPAPPTSIPGTQFYSLHPSAVAGTTLLFDVSPSADLSDGLQLSELSVLTPNAAAGIGSNVIFHFNGREEGTGRYHPLFLQLYADGTGIVQNANNQGGINPITNEVVDLDFGDEYVTHLAFDASTFTLAVPEPSLTAILLCGALALRRRR